MVDIFNKQPKETIKELKKRLDDPFLANLVIAVIKDLHERKTKSYHATWHSMTRRMFHDFPALVVYKMVEEALEEASDEEWFEKKYPNWVFKDAPPKERMEMSEYSGIKNLISKRLNITEVARRYGLKVRGSKAICPFHVDKNPSLSFSDEKNVFNCFGCGTKGDIIKFIGLMEDEKKRGRAKSN